MIAYNPRWLDALHISREAKRWRAGEIISARQYAAIKTQFTTPLYTPNLFIRVVLFFFTSIALGGVYGMLVVVVGRAGALAFGSVIVGLAALVALEALVKGRHLYQSGMDDALLYAALLWSIGGVIWLYLGSAPWTRDGVVPWLLALPCLIGGAVRFADRAVTAAAYVCTLAIALTPLFDVGPAARGSLPFVAMAVAVISYALTRRYREKEILWPYESCLSTVGCVALATFYGAGNYLVGRRASVLLMQTVIPEGQAMPAAWLFYALTALTPVAYIVAGLVVRDHLLLRAGLIAAVLSVLTVAYDLQIWRPEVTLTGAGVALFLIAVGSTAHVKTRRDGYTAKRLLEEALKGLDAEALAVAQTLGGSPQPGEKGFEGGGGKFGGGGTSEKW